MIQRIYLAIYLGDVHNSTMTDKDFQKVGKLINDSNIASEQRILEVVKKEISASEKRVLVEIGTFVTDELLPAIDEKADKSGIDRLERRMDLFADNATCYKKRHDVIASDYKNGEHEVRLRDIESIPTVPIS